MEREFSVVIERDEDGYYIGTVPEFKGCHTQAKSLDELIKRVEEAILLCLDEELGDRARYLGMGAFYNLGQ